VLVLVLMVLKWMGLMLQPTPNEKHIEYISLMKETLLKYNIKFIVRAPCFATPFPS
jgi:hypothetical protein